MLLSNLNLLATAPGGVARLRELILTLAVQGKLVPQDPHDEPANELLKKIRSEKDRLVAEGKIKRDKPLAEIAEEEKPFALPQSWEWSNLATVGVINPRNEAPDEAIASFVEMRSIPAAFSAAHTTESRPWRDIKSGFTQFAEGDVGVAKITPCFENGKSTVFENLSNGIGAGTTELHIVRPLGGIAPRYLLLFLKTPAFLLNGEAVMTGSAGQKRMPRIFFESTPFPLPPLAEQSRIVTRVEELMRLCDVLEAKGQLEAKQHAQLVSTLLGTLTDSETPEELADNWQRIATHFDLLLDRPEAVDALEQTILQLAVRGLLVPQDPQDEPASELLKKIRAEKDRLIAEGKIKRDKPLQKIAKEEHPFTLPMGWEWVRVGDIGVTQTGGTPASSKPEYFGGSFPFIGPGQITPAGEILPPEKFISELGRLESAVAEPGDILMVCIGGSIGKCTCATYTTAFNQQINSIHPVLASNEYVLNAMTEGGFMAAVLSTAAGSATPIISKGKWDLLLLSVPPLAEQHRIVTRVVHLRRLCADLRQRLAAAGERQSQLAQSVVEMQSTTTA